MYVGNAGARTHLHLNIVYSYITADMLATAERMIKMPG
jgi:hypothetical protein